MSVFSVLVVREGKKIAMKIIVHFLFNYPIPVVFARPRVQSNFRTFVHGNEATKT